MTTSLVITAMPAACQHHQVRLIYLTPTVSIEVISEHATIQQVPMQDLKQPVLCQTSLTFCKLDVPSISGYFVLYFYST